MVNNTSTCLLQQLEDAGCRVDVDSFVPRVAQSLPFTPHDATSNQALIGLCVYAPENQEMVRRTIESMPGSTPLEVLTTLVRQHITTLKFQHAKFAKIQLKNISGRVLVQSSPSFPYDEDSIVGHGQAYARALQAEGVPLERFAIKIPTTSAGVRAARRLKQEGIQSLGTTLFSVPQAIAASQAGMYAISPYFNPCRAHDDESLFVDVADPVAEHPMSSRMLQIRQTYDKLKKLTGRCQPQIKGAGFITAREVLAQVELGCDNVTVLPASLEDLISCSKTPAYAPGEWSRRWKAQLGNYDVKWSDWSAQSTTASHLKAVSEIDPLGGILDGPLHPADTDIDYLEEDALDKFNEADPATSFRLADAIDTFKKGEEKLFEFIVSLQKQDGRS